MDYTFEEYKKRALNASLSKWEKIGFPDSYRKNMEGQIYSDINGKLKLDEDMLNLLDIGCGCSELVEQMIINSTRNSSNLYLVDSGEMLNNINKELLSDKVKLIHGSFPKIDYFDTKFNNFFDRILVYSVLHIAFLEQDIYGFIHKCIDMLKPDGLLLIGDIPNISCRNRFLESEKGKNFLNKAPKFQNSINLKRNKKKEFDDSLIISIISRFRNFGCETYLLPQPDNLPFGNRREDILIIKR